MLYQSDYLELQIRKESIINRRSCFFLTMQHFFRTILATDALRQSASVASIDLKRAACSEENGNYTIFKN